MPSAGVCPVDFTAIYTELKTARLEIPRRQGDHDPRRRVRKYLSGVMPGMGEEPVAFFARTVVTPNHEAFLFLKKAAMLGLRE